MRVNRSEYSKEYYRSNRARILAAVKMKSQSRKLAIQKYLRDYYKKNRKKIIASVILRERNNPDWARQKRRKYNQSPKGKIASTNARTKRRAKEYAADVLDSEREEIEFIYGLCRALSLGGNKHHVDHIIPLSRGGGHRTLNLRIIPAKANLSKHNKLISN